MDAVSNDCHRTWLKRSDRRDEPEAGKSEPMTLLPGCVNPSCGPREPRPRCRESKWWGLPMAEI